MNMKRARGRNFRPGGGGGGGGGPVRHQSGNIPLNRNHTFDSSGPDLRVRGTAQQLFEKYLQLGRDASSSGDRVMAESYFQHAEHYFRIVNAINQAAQHQGGPQAQHGGGQPHQQRHHRDGDGDGEDGDSQPAGYGEQPGGAQVEVREIPIAAAPSDA
ncbi:MAG: DUF4167 domain-containing protein [Acetobacteraceae bacterium]|nr:DUF4167 domain-containing protein [Acetobacteraceae bacterium]